MAENADPAPAAQYDIDGRPDRYPGQPDRGQSVGDEPIDRVVRAQAGIVPLRYPGALRRVYRDLYSLPLL
jgi:hypothetical protein